MLDVAVRWEGHQWVAYNIGHKPKYANQDWSTSLGPCEAEDILDLFRHCWIMFWPAHDLRR